MTLLPATNTLITISPGAGFGMGTSWIVVWISGKGWTMTSFILLGRELDGVDCIGISQETGGVKALQGMRSGRRSFYSSPDVGGGRKGLFVRIMNDANPGKKMLHSVILNAITGEWSARG